MLLFVPLPKITPMATESTTRGHFGASWGGLGGLFEATKHKIPVLICVLLCFVCRLFLFLALTKTPPMATGSATRGPLWSLLGRPWRSPGGQSTTRFQCCFAFYFAFRVVLFVSSLLRKHRPWLHNRPKRDHLRVTLETLRVASELVGFLRSLVGYSVAC